MCLLQKSPDWESERSPQYVTLRWLYKQDIPPVLGDTNDSICIILSKSRVLFSKLILNGKSYLLTTRRQYYVNKKSMTIIDTEILIYSVLETTTTPAAVNMQTSCQISRLSVQSKPDSSLFKSCVWNCWLLSIALNVHSNFFTTRV